jgi:hypothetical protein
MTSGTERELFAMMADITGVMEKIWELLSANPAVKKAARSCDLRRFQGEPEQLCYGSYVEADTHSGKTLVWSLEVTLTATAWSMDRSVAEQVSEGQDNKRDFGEVTFDSFDAMARRYPALLAEFAASARDFDFAR